MTAVLKGLFRWVARWPLPVLHLAGWGLGWLSFLLSARYRRRLLDHARQAGQPLRVALASVAESGKLAMETPRLWLGRSLPYSWDGIEVVEQAMRDGSGLLYFTPHLGCFEITAQALAARFGDRMPITVLFRPARQAWLAELMTTARSRPGLMTAPTTLAGVKQLIKALKGRQAVGLLPDQVPPAGQGVWAPFFGREAYTMTLSARLAHTEGVKLLLIWGERLSWARGFVVHVRPLADWLPEGLSRDPLQAATQINRVMESLVRRVPSQYIWSYDRYKAPRSTDAAGAATGAAAAQP